MSAVQRLIAVAPLSRRGRLGLAGAVGLGAVAVLAAVGLLTTSGYLISRAAQHPEILSLAIAIVGVRFFGSAARPRPLRRAPRQPRRRAALDRRASAAASSPRSCRSCPPASALIVVASC